VKSDCRVVAVIRRLHIRISRLGFQKWAKTSHEVAPRRDKLFRCRDRTREASHKPQGLRQAYRTKVSPSHVPFRD
jgi:hypothetical protein